jgi:hypothetical protein
MSYIPPPPDPPLKGRPANEANAFQRQDKPYYTFLDIRPLSGDEKIFVPVNQWKDIYFFRGTTESTGWYRYEKPTYDWYLETAIEKLNKLPAADQANLDRSFVFSLRYAIRQKYQRGGSQSYELPACRNNRQAVENWIKKTLDQYEDKVD